MGYSQKDCGSENRPDKCQRRNGTDKNLFNIFWLTLRNIFDFSSSSNTQSQLLSNINTHMFLHEPVCWQLVRVTGVLFYGIQLDRLLVEVDKQHIENTAVLYRYTVSELNHCAVSYREYYIFLLLYFTRFRFHTFTAYYAFQIFDKTTVHRFSTPYTYSSTLDLCWSRRNLCSILTCLIDLIKIHGLLAWGLPTYYAYGSKSDKSLLKIRAIFMPTIVWSVSALRAEVSSLFRSTKLKYDEVNVQSFSKHCWDVDSREFDMKKLSWTS